MAEFDLRITGKGIAVRKNNRHVVTVEGNIHRINFMIPGEDSQMIWELNRGKDIWITFYGRLLCVEDSNENEVIIRGDINSYEGTMWYDDITRFVVAPNGAILHHW